MSASGSDDDAGSGDPTRPAGQPDAAPPSPEPSPATSTAEAATAAPAPAQGAPGAPPGHGSPGVPGQAPPWYGQPYYGQPGQPPPGWGPPPQGYPYGPPPGDPAAWGQGPGPYAGYPAGPPGQPAPWPPPYGWGPPPPAKPSAVGVWLNDLFKVYFPRAFRLHLDSNAVLPQERAALEAANPPVRHPLLQAFLVWRRSLLMVAAVVLVPVTILRTVETATSLGDVSETLKAIAVLQLLAEIAFAVALWVLLPKWTNWAGQRSALQKWWLAYFLFPFLLWLFPYRSLMEGGTRGQLLIMGMTGALGAILTLAPRALSLMPGLLRASIISKTLFPGASAPGWLVALAAPIYALLVYVILLMPYQITGSVLLVFAMILFVAAPIVLGRNGVALARPMGPEEAHRLIVKTRTNTLILNGLGALFLVIGLGQMVSELELNALSAVNPVLVLLANVLLISLVGTDLLLVSLDRARTLLADAGNAQHRAMYEAQLLDFVQAQHSWGATANQLPQPSGETAAPEAGPAPPGEGVPKP